jgi:hypothetical protein
MKTLSGPGDWVIRPWHEVAVSTLILAVLAAACAGPLGGRSESGSSAEPVRMEIPMPSSAMEPTYRCGKPPVGCSAEEADVLVVAPTSDVTRGDVIAYKTTKRARTQCGAGGVFVHRVQRIETGGGLYVIGDNRSQSCDSRVFGSIPPENLLGKVVGVRRR